MSIRTRIVPCLWFDDQAEEAVHFYMDIFPESRIITRGYYTEAGKEFHGHRPGDLMTVEFELDGQHFTALNGGPIFTFSEAISFQIYCADQAEIDHYWGRLTQGGEEQPCGWLRDRFGVSWQVVPASMLEMFEKGPSEALERAMAAMFQMKKLDVAAIEKAYYG